MLKSIVTSTALLVLARHGTLFLSIFTAHPFPSVDAAVGLSLKLFGYLAPDHTRELNQSHVSFQSIIGAYRQSAAFGEEKLGLVLIGTNNGPEPSLMRVNEFTTVHVSQCAGRQGTLSAQQQHADAHR